MAKIGIAGASGYTGFELLRLLTNHPNIEIVFLTSETYQGEDISKVFPSIRGLVDTKLSSIKSVSSEACDLVFLALPHTTSMDKVPIFLSRGTKVIDLSADYRLKDPTVFKDWYSFPHNQPALLKEAVYGLPEIHREKIKSARLVANPGCYPTSITLALAPLVTEDWVSPVLVARYPLQLSFLKLMKGSLPITLLSTDTLQKSNKNCQY
jgi:N-acetyl-gamma-glutamyl-phosphate reductase